jgi:hypothetical protein
LAAVLGALLPGGAKAHASDAGYPWFFSPEANVPVSLKLTVMGVASCHAGGRYCVDFPLLTFGFDLKRPSIEGGSVSFAFAQAPLVGYAAIAAVESGSDALGAAGLLLAWLSGGMFRWAPGGDGNVRDQPRDTITLALVLKNEIAVHPFVRPVYVRAMPGLGLALTRASWSEGMPGLFMCGVGAFASFAAEYGGQRAFDPGAWLTCYFTGD